MKLALMPKQLTWWIWLATLTMMAAGLAGYPAAFLAATALTLAHTLLFWRRSRDPHAISVQIRFAYALLLAVSYMPQLRWLYWLSAIGAAAMLVLGYCLMGRMLSLLPWNRTEPLTPDLMRRTFLSAPVISRMHPASACGGVNGVCELESRAASFAAESERKTLLHAVNLKPQLGSDLLRSNPFRERRN